MISSNSLDDRHPDADLFQAIVAALMLASDFDRALAQGEDLARLHEIYCLERAELRRISEIPASTLMGLEAKTALLENDDYRENCEFLAMSVIADAARLIRLAA